MAARPNPGMSATSRPPNVLNYTKPGAEAKGLFGGVLSAARIARRSKKGLATFKRAGRGRGGTERVPGRFPTWRVLAWAIAIVPGAACNEALNLSRRFAPRRLTPARYTARVTARGLDMVCRESFHLKYV
jgi:hypothetical protein